MSNDTAPIEIKLFLAVSAAVGALSTVSFIIGVGDVGAVAGIVMFITSPFLAREYERAVGSSRP